MLGLSSQTNYGALQDSFFCKNEDLLRGIKQHTPAPSTTMCRNARKPLLQTSPSVQSTVLVFALGTNCLPGQYPSTGSSSVSCTLNLKINIYFHFSTNVFFHVYIGIHRNYIMSEYVYKVNMNLPLPLFLACSSVCLGTKKEESEHTETLGQGEQRNPDCEQRGWKHKVQAGEKCEIIYPTLQQSKRILSLIWCFKSSKFSTNISQTNEISHLRSYSFYFHFKGIFLRLF